jgi:hypothetical protein
MAITTEAGYIAAKASGSFRRFFKLSIANALGATIMSMWRSTGPFPAQPVIPGAAVVCDRTTPGALDLPAVTGANTRYIDAFNVQLGAAGQVRFVDRVIHSGNLNATVITAQAVNTPALPARAAALNCDWFLECYTDSGVTAVSATVAVTYTDATTANLVVAVPATWRAGRLLQIFPTTGKVIASVQNVTLSATTGTAGAFGLTAQQDIGVNAMVPSANFGDKADSMVLPIPADACLTMVVDCTTTVTGNIVGGLRIIEG